MSNPSNLYAEKVFSEHPTVLWALDDKADYVSLITENQRVLSDSTKWDITGGTVSSYPQSIDEPFIDSSVSKIIGDLTSEDFGEVVCISKDILNFSELNSYMSTFAVGAYLYSISSYISNIEIGYEYYDSMTGQKIQKLKNYNTSIYQNWFFVAETFEIPPENTTFSIVIKIRYVGGATSTEDYQFLINGVTVGQWSEDFHSTSLGISKEQLPSSISLTSSDVIEAKSYGLIQKPGYYFIKDNALLAKKLWDTFGLWF